jgi:hypothetical protein
MQYTISIAGEELLRFEETWPDNIPYRPVLFPSGFISVVLRDERFASRDHGSLGAAAIPRRS